MTDKNLRNELEKFVTDLRGDSDHWKKVLPHANDEEHRARLETRIQEQHDVAEDLRQILNQTVGSPAPAPPGSARILDPVSGRQLIPDPQFAVQGKSEIIASILRSYWASHQGDHAWLNAQYEADEITQEDRERYDTEVEANAEAADLRARGED